MTEYKLLTYKANEPAREEDGPSPRDCLDWWFRQEFEPTWYDAWLSPENGDPIQIPCGQRIEIFRRLRELGYGDVCWCACWVDHFPNVYVDESGWHGMPICDEYLQGWVDDGWMGKYIGTLSISPVKKAYLSE